MLGATRTANGPEVAPEGIVMLIELSLQELLVAVVPFRITALFPCVAPNPEPEITTELPTDPVVAETPLITGPGVPGVVMDTLSNVAVAKLDVVLLLTANPMYTLCAMLMAWLLPTCTQFTPSAAAKLVNVFPLRTSFTQ
jgi:hypothetical protein